MFFNYLYLSLLGHQLLGRRQKAAIIIATVLALVLLITLLNFVILNCTSYHATNPDIPHAYSASGPFLKASALPADNVTTIQNHKPETYLTIYGILVNPEKKGYDGPRLRNNRKSYAEWLGKNVNVHFRNEAPSEKGNINWAKLRDIKKMVGQSEWAWQLDSDAFIMQNANYSIFDIIKNAEKKNPDVNLIIAKDCNGINAGSFLIRTGAKEWSEKFLTQWLTFEDDKEIPNMDIWAEQATLTAMIKFNTHSIRDKHLVYEEQKNFNSFTFQCTDEFKKGGLVLHAPSLGYGNLVNYMKEKNIVEFGG